MQMLDVRSLAVSSGVCKTWRTLATFHAKQACWRTCVSKKTDMAEALEEVFSVASRVPFKPNCAFLFFSDSYLKADSVTPRSSLPGLVASVQVALVVVLLLSRGVAGLHHPARQASRRASTTRPARVHRCALPRPHEPTAQSRLYAHADNHRAPTIAKHRAAAGSSIVGVDAEGVQHEIEGTPSRREAVGLSLALAHVNGDAKVCKASHESCAGTTC